MEIRTQTHFNNIFSLFLLLNFLVGIRGSVLNGNTAGKCFLEYEVVHEHIDMIV